MKTGYAIHNPLLLSLYICMCIMCMYHVQHIMSCAYFFAIPVGPQHRSSCVGSALMCSIGMRSLGWIHRVALQGLLYHASSGITRTHSRIIVHTRSCPCIHSQIHPVSHPSIYLDMRQRVSGDVMNRQSRVACQLHGVLIDCFRCL